MADFLTEALKWGYSKKDIADYLAQESGEQDFVTKARGYGYKDDQIIAELMGSGAGKAFTSQFEQGFKSSLQGIGQMLGMANTEDIRAQREAADILSSNNPYAGFAGNLLGNIVDPIALPAAAVAPLRGATLAATLAKKGAAQGAFSGFVEPVTKEGASTGPVSLDRVLNTIISTPIGAALGGGAGALISKFGKKAEVPGADVAKTQEDTTTAAQRALDELQQAEQALATRAPEQTPVGALNELPITGPGVASRLASDAEVQALTTRRAQLQSEVDDLLWRQAETPAPVNVADNLPSTSRGLFTPTRAADEPQVPALFQRPQQATPEVPVGRTAQEAALFRGGLDNAIQTRQAEIANIDARLAEREQLIANRNKPDMVQVETKKSPSNLELTPIQKQQEQELSQINQKISSLTEQLTPLAGRSDLSIKESETFNSLFNEWMPLNERKKELEQIVRGFRSGGSSAVTSNALPTQKLTPEQEQAILSKYGFTSRQEAEATLAPPVTKQEAPEAPKAPETDYAEGRSALNLGFGKGSVGSAETPKELVYAGDVPFNTKAEKVFSDYKPRKVTVANIRNDAEDTELVNKVVMATGSTGRGIRGQRLGPASFDNMGRRAEAAEARMTREASDLIDWVLQNGNKEWNADEVAAIAPQFYKSVDFLRNTMREYNALRAAGKMTDDLETEIMLKSQMHLGIVTIFQGQRSRASAKMNALKFAKDRVLNGERVNGYATPGAGCV